MNDIQISKLEEGLCPHCDNVELRKAEHVGGHLWDKTPQCPTCNFRDE